LKLEPPNQLGFWCNIGAISVEKMEIIDSMDITELTPLREKTEITP
jgi:hypothetical protein